MKGRLVDELADFVRDFYEAMILKKFKPDQALELTKVYLNAIFMRGQGDAASWSPPDSGRSYDRND